jgi:hypothetical protein
MSTKAATRSTWQQLMPVMLPAFPHFIEWWLNEYPIGHPDLKFHL